MAKSKVQVAYDLSSGEEDDQSSDTTADEDVEADEDVDADEDVEDAMEAEVKNEADNDDDVSGSDDDDEDEASDGEKADGEEDEEEKVGSGDDEAQEQKSGLADVMAKILRKQAPDNKPVILSKALTDKELRLKRKIKDQEETGDMQPKKKKPHDDDSSSDEDTGLMTKEQLLKKKAWEELGRRKVDITQRESERRLQRVATKGVLQLFNAVAKQQKIIEDRLREVGSSERRKDDVMKSMSKGAFLDMLKTTPNVCDEPVEERKKLVKKKPSKGEDSDSDDSEGDVSGKPSWNILREDFMMGAKMKDWDKESEDDDGQLSDGADDGDSSGSDG